MLGIGKRKKRIGIFGGAFNPPTLAHEKVVDYLLENTNLEEIWVMPCGNHRFKKNLLDWKHRLAMCELAFIGKPNVYVKSFDCAVDSDGSTVSLMHSIKAATFGMYDFTFIVGQDNADDSYKWKNWSYLRDTTKFIVLPRGDKQATKYDWYNIKPHKFLNKFKKLDTSSTSVRNVIKSLNDITAVIDHRDQLEYEMSKHICYSVSEYTKRFKLYRKEKQKAVA